MNKLTADRSISQQNTVQEPSLTVHNPYRTTIKQIIFIFLTAVAVITICSKSSPIYPFNDWGDANCFLTVGRSMLHGLVPYRDLYEQKGPILYMLHALTSLISDNSFLGVYFLEIIAGCFFLFYSYLSMKLIYNDISIISVPILATVVYSATCFCHGDSAEELCLPLLAYTLYLGLKMIHRHIPLTRRECFIIGITSGCVLWIKFSLLGFYIGWICIVGFFFYRKKKAKELFHDILWIAFGVVIISIPVLLYFGINDAVADLFEVYFYDNIFLYSNNESFASRIVTSMTTGLIHFAHYNFLTMMSVIFGISVVTQKKDRADFQYILIVFMTTFIFIYIGGQYYTYYSLILSVFTPIGIVAIFQLLQERLATTLFSSISKYKKNACTVAVCLICLITSFILCDNTYLLEYKKEDMPQYKFAEDITNPDTATMLNWGFPDGGFYTVSGILPTCKYFHLVNMPVTEIVKSHNNPVLNGLVEYVVTEDVELNTDLYDCIDTCPFYYENADHTYYLYKLIE